MVEYATYLITWTTYGTWLPGDERGWKKRSGGLQAGQPKLEQWCRDKLKTEPVLLRPCDRQVVERACGEHCTYRGWELLAVNARSNHVHAVVSADLLAEKVRDQLKANCTRALRQQGQPLHREKTWTTGGDCQFLPTQEAIEAAMFYVLEGQDNRPPD